MAADDYVPSKNPIAGMVGALGIAAAVLASGAVASDAHMYQYEQPPAREAVVALQSSTIQTSEAIKTMDFSMPSSYDSIADAKKTATDELTVIENTVTGTKRKVSSSSSSGGGGGGEKKKGITAEERAAIKAEREAEKAAIAAEKAAEKEAANAAAAAKQKEAAAAKAAAAAEKAEAAKAAKAAAEEKKEAKKASTAAKNMDFVDMGLPSYSDSAKTEGKKSPFAL